MTQSHSGHCVTVWNWGGFSCRFRIKGPHGETDQGGDKPVGGSSDWSYEELYAKGFQDGDSCWASVDVDGGSTNHDSGDNFNLDGGQHSYRCDGTIFSPSFSLQS